jgi:hypothetical protein
VVGVRTKLDKEKLVNGTRVALDMTTLTIMAGLYKLHSVDPKLAARCTGSRPRGASEINFNTVHSNARSDNPITNNLVSDLVVGMLKAPGFNA